VNGILNLNKPKGWTSHDVVAHVRRLTHIRRVGHAGTLDPMATGVLLICLGQATRIVEYLMTGRKHYQTVMRLGISTDSHDADGQVTARAPVDVSRGEVERALSRFRGTVEQVPPMVSALKRQGQPLYKLARQGITVEREPRKIRIHHLELTDWNPPSISLDLYCSAGTYVRALARDMGRVLGCGAHLTSLTRLASGDFTLTDALEWEQFAKAFEPDTMGQVNGEPSWHRLVMPMDAGLRHLPDCELDSSASRRVRSGQPLSGVAIPAPTDKLVRAYESKDAERRLIALLSFDDNAGLWRPRKVFYPL
jgi:tRNA pseudouridine55 synthase